VRADGALSPRLPATVCLGFPRRAQLLLFDGNLFHGVLHPPPRDTSYLGAHCW